MAVEIDALPDGPPDSLLPRDMHGSETHGSDVIGRGGRLLCVSAALGWCIPKDGDNIFVDSCWQVSTFAAPVGCSTSS